MGKFKDRREEIYSMSKRKESKNHCIDVSCDISMSIILDGPSLDLLSDWTVARLSRDKSKAAKNDMINSAQLSVKEQPIPQAILPYCNVSYPI